MPSTIERKMTFLPRILYPVTPAQETSGKHAFLYQEHKFHERKTVGGKEFLEWHYLADLEDTQARQNSETQQKGYVEGWHHQDPCWQRIFLPEGRTLGWAPILICACFPDEVLALLCSCIHLIWVHLLHPQASSTPEGWKWVMVILQSSPPLLTIFLLEVQFLAPPLAQCDTLSIYQGPILAQWLCWENC